MPTPASPKAPSVAPGSTPIQKVVVVWAAKDEDLSGNPFQWARPLLKNPVDSDGKPCPRHGSIMVYGTKKRDGVETIYLLPRNIGGLYDFLPAEGVAEALSALGMTEEELSTITVAAPLEDPSVSSTERRMESRKKRRDRREAALKVVDPAANAAMVSLVSTPANANAEVAVS